MAGVWLCDPRRLRADPKIACGSDVCSAKSADPRFAQLILGSEVCVRDPRIIAQNSDPRFAQQNPRMVRIRTFYITYTHFPFVREFFYIFKHEKFPIYFSKLWQPKFLTTLVWSVLY